MKTKTEHQEQIRNAKVPGWFKCRLFEASEGRRPSGAHAVRTGYADAGVALAENLHRLFDHNKIAEIERRRQDGYLERWTCENLKAFYALIPTRKRQVFLQGFRRGLVRCGYIYPTIDVVGEVEQPTPLPTYLRVVEADESDDPRKYIRVASVTTRR